MVFDMKLYKPPAYAGVSKSLLQNTKDCKSQKPFTLPYRSICHISEKVV